MKELKDYTSQELFNELSTRDDLVVVKMWDRKDLVEQAKSILMRRGKELPEKDVEEIVDISMACLKCVTNEELDTGYGQDVIAYAIEEFKEKNDGKEEERVSKHTA